MAQGPGGFEVLENPMAEEIFADEALAFSLVNGVLRITLSSFRPTETGSAAAHVVIGRLVMPTVGAQGLCVGLFNFLKEMGCDPSAVVQGDQTAQ